MPLLQWDRAFAGRAQSGQVTFRRRAGTSPPSTGAQAEASAGRATAPPKGRPRRSRCAPVISGILCRGAPRAHGVVLRIRAMEGGAGRPPIDPATVMGLWHRARLGALPGRPDASARTRRASAQPENESSTRLGYRSQEEGQGPEARAEARRHPDTPRSSFNPLFDRSLRISGRRLHRLSRATRKRPRTPAPSSR
jgi:hypothetical protein